MVSVLPWPKGYDCNEAKCGMSLNRTNNGWVISLEGLEGQLALSLVAIAMDGAGGEFFVVQKVVEGIRGALGLNKDQGA